MRQFDLDRLAFGELLAQIAGGTCTERGRARLLAVTPFADLDELQSHQEIHREVARTLDSDRRPPFESIPDVDELLTQLETAGARLDGSELWDLRLVAGALEAMQCYLHGPGREPLTTWLKLFGPITSYRTEIEALDRALEPGGAIRSTATPELQRLRRSIGRAEEKMRQRAHSLAESLHRAGTAQEPEPALRDGRFVIAVPAEHRHRVNGVALDRSRSGQTFFIEPPDLAEAALELRALHREEEQEVLRIRAELTALCAARGDDLEADLDRLASLDALQAAARFTGAGELTLPEVTADRGLELTRARHPLLARSIGSGSVIPLTLSLSESERTLVISGPNAGGKTIALQTVGLCTALGLCGLPIPACEPSRIPWVDRIHIDIGDEQSYEADLSTFTARLRRLREMLAEPRGSELCLIDEAGAGTDPAQGAALAIAVLEELNTAGAWTVCITHDGRIKNHAAQSQGMLNGRMIFSDSSLTPTYEFQAGEPGRSYAFEIAARSGLPGDIIERARAWLGPDERNLEEVLRETEALRAELSASTRAAEKDARLAARERAEWETLRTELAGNEERERRRAAEEAGRFVSRARQAIEEAVREIRESGAARPAIKKAHAAVRSLEKEVSSLTTPPPQTADTGTAVPLAEGDRVLVRTLQRPATVLRADSDRVRVQAGSLALEVDRNELEPLSEEPETRPRTVVTTPLKSVPQQLEIIGLRAGEARRRVEKYLDDALLAGYARIRIIHGAGTGVLRRVVAEVCRDHPAVASCALEQDSPGGTGVTAVEFSGGGA